VLAVFTPSRENDGWTKVTTSFTLVVKSQPVNMLPTAAFRAFENIGTSSHGNCDSELIRAQQVSDASNWEGF